MANGQTCAPQDRPLTLAGPEDSYRRLASPKAEEKQFVFNLREPFVA